MWELDCEESWALKNWCFLTEVLEKTLTSPLDCKKIQPLHPKGDQFWVFIGRTDVEAETPILWPPDAEVTHLKRPWSLERLRAGGEGDDRGWDGWMASPTWWTWVWVNSGVGGGQGGLKCCHSWGHKESDTTERLHFHFSLSCNGEGNGNPLQCSCLENPRDGEAWWAAVYGVTQSWTRLKRLSSSSNRWINVGGKIT